MSFSSEGKERWKEKERRTKVDPESARFSFGAIRNIATPSRDDVELIADFPWKQDTRRIVSRRKKKETFFFSLRSSFFTLYYVHRHMYALFQFLSFILLPT